jgi:O-antigen/teichoic acid export membrane protein
MAGKLLALSILAPQSSIAALKEAVAYSKWVALSGIAYIAMPYLARFILAVRASVEEVGIFSAGMTFTVAFSTLNTAVRAVIFPQVTALEGREEIRRYLGRLARIAPYYTVLAVLGIACLGSLQWAVLGEEYRTALPVFLVTAGAFAAVVFLGLGTMLVHTMMRPQVDAWVNVVRLGLMVLLASILVPSFHALGAAAAYVVPVLIGEVWMFRYVEQKSSGGL